MKKLSNFLYYLFLLLVIFPSSCKREIELTEKVNSLQAKMGKPGIQSLSNSSGCVVDQDNGSNYDTVPRPTTLGYRLVNSPYSVANMQQASLNLYGTTSGITENKWYVRFKPANPQQLGILDSLDLDLFDYPLDYEVTQEGDYYNDGVTPPETIPWLYTVVAPNFVFPAGIQYELLQRMHVPTLGSLEREAFSITGNPVQDTACTSTLQATTQTITPHVAGDCPNGYIWDPFLRECVRRTTSPPPPSPTRQPSGTVLVTDNNRNTNVPVRNVRVIARRFLKVERTYTNNQGQYFITKEFNKVNILVRTKTDRANIRSLRRARLWQMLTPVKIHLGKFTGPINNLQHVVGYDANALSAGSRHWAALSVHNNVQEYYDYAAQLGIGTPPGGIKILLTNWRLQGVVGATPMYAKRYWQDLPETFITYFLISHIPAGALISQWVFVLKTQVDVTLGYNLYNRSQRDVTASSDEMGEVAFHELTHAAHYNKVGNSWYNEFVDAEINQMIFSGNSPYGYGTAGTKSEIISLGESWAYHMGHFLSDRKYGLRSSDAIEQGIRYTNSTTTSSHIRLLEDYNPNKTDNPDRWIPIGLYNDLTDVTNETGVPVFDGVSNFTNQQLFNALDPDIKSMLIYRDRLVGENPTNQVTEVRNLFSQYNIR